MDSLMAALVAALLIRLTDRSADWTAALAEASDQPGAVLGGATLSIIATHALAAVAGWFIGQHMTPNPKMLMLGVMLLLAAAGAVWPGKPVAPPAPDHPFRRSAAHLFATGLNGRNECVVFALAAGGTAALAGIGGVLGSMAILTAAALGGELLWRPLPHRAIGFVVGALLGVVAIWLALSALRLI